MGDHGDVKEVEKVRGGGSRFKFAEKSETRKKFFTFWYYFQKKYLSLMWQNIVFNYFEFHVKRKNFLRFTYFFDKT